MFRFNSSRTHLRDLNAAVAATVPTGALILDAGAGSGPYRDLFNHTRYESADFVQVDKEYGQITYVCDLSDIPVEDERFDFILFNQVLEHLPEPKDSLKELHRILKKGGRILYTGPFFYEEHEQPYDYFRYTQFSLRYLFSQAGLQIERLEWLEGYYGTLGYQLETAAKALPLSPRHYGGGLVAYAVLPAIGALKVAFVSLSLLFQRLDVRHKFIEAGYPKNYVVLAKRA